MRHHVFRALPFPGSRRRAALLAQVVLMMALIAFADWRVDADVPLGFLYLLPMLVAAGTFGPAPIVLLAAFSTALTEAFDSFGWTPASGIPRDVLYFAAFAGFGLFVHEIASRRRLSAVHLDQLETEINARRGVEEQLENLIRSSPVAIFTADGDGRILMANDAAERLFLTAAGAFAGEQIHHYLPALASVPALAAGKRLFRTVMQCKGHRANGSIFLADVWFSTYQTSVGPRLAAMVVDASENLRDREEMGLHQLLSGSRILVGAISHEIRNICGAIAVVHQNLLRCEHLIENRDFEALGTLVLALERIASMELRQTADMAVSVDLQSFLEELRIVIEPALLDAEVVMRWEIPVGLPAVWADRQSLMQVFLNLVKNSERALHAQPQPRISIRAEIEAHRVLISIIDNGSGVSSPDLLFRPFQPNSKATGLGLYLSRALMRSFRGDLHYLALPQDTAGAAFVVELARAPSSENDIYDEQSQAAAG